MNTLEKDFNQFLNRRLNHVEAQLPVMHNAAANALERSIIEEAAYRQGMIDALGIIGSLGH